MLLKAELMDESAVRRSIARISHEIVEHYHGTDNLILLGIRRRGLPIAEMIADNIARFENVRLPVGHIDITRYRDDLTEPIEQPETADSFLPVSLDKRHIILVDDVIYTGRTVRAAIEFIFRSGRPASIALAALIDRGHRELPIRPDFVGKNVPTSKTELIAVHMPPFEEDICVKLCER